MLSFFQYNTTVLHKESMKMQNVRVCNLIASMCAAIF